MPRTRSQSVRLICAAVAVPTVALYGILFAANIHAQSAAFRPGQSLSFPTATRLVQVSVLVHEKGGAPVRGLTAADFQLFEQGREQTIETFSEESEPELPAGVAPKASEGAQTLFTNQAQGRGGATIILLDRLNTAWEDQARSRDQVVQFLGQIQPDDRVGLYLLESNRVRVLHDFSTDAASLLRSLARHKGATSAEYAASTERTFETGDTEMDVFLAETTQIVTAAFMRRRAEATSDALVAIASHLAGVVGRKNLVWVSSAFPLTFDDPVGRGSAPGLSTGTVSPDVVRATRALSEAGIAVYPVDARGLVGAFAVDPASIPFSRNSAATTRGAFTTLSSVMSPLDTAKTIAENTGGRAYYNTNDIRGAIRRAVDDARVTYLIGYSPTHTQWNGSFREIKVKVRRPGVEVRHRKGYLATPSKEPQRGDLGRAIAKTLQNPLQAAGIPLGVRIEKGEGALNREVNLAIGIDARPITLERKGETWRGTIGLVIAQSDATGRVFKDFDKNIDLTLTREMMERILTEGVVMHKKVTLRDDANQLRFVVNDPATGALGSLVISVERLRLSER